MSAVWQLARIAGCASPDSIDSPGAQFLELVAGCVDDRGSYADDDSDAAHEIADGCVPVYTHQMWETFVDLQAYDEDLSELGVDASDMTRCAMVCLYQVAYRLAAALIAQRGEDEARDDEGMVV